jgi:hypothetical protein
MPLYAQKFLMRRAHFEKFGWRRIAAILNRGRFETKEWCWQKANRLLSYRRLGLAVIGAIVGEDYEQAIHCCQRSAR